jgi:peptidoglycan/xylan/chitin deacetylase (PgdA/CDA1 family)
MSRLLARVRRRASLLLLPLSVAPFVAGIPAIVHSHQAFQREHDMGPLPAPSVGLSAAETRRYSALRATPGRIPVLAWTQEPDRRAFARQLALLHRLGYTAISTAQWARFRTGDRAGLPAKPILLTIDGGRLSSYRAADRVLQRFSMRAATFVSTGAIESGDWSYTTWAELHRMVASGRWDVEPQGHEGNREITASPGGAQAPYYAARRYTRSAGRETLASWEARVAGDVFTARDRFAAQGFVPHVFAVPYGDYGQHTDNDPAIRGLLRNLLRRQFGSFFAGAAGNDPGFSVAGTGVAHRYELHTGTTLGQLYGWLREHSAPPVSNSSSKR